jgi:ATP-dependent DNA helicase RecQ
MAMMDEKPSNLLEMSHISGIGEKKLELYGEKFLAVLQNFSMVDLTDTVAETVELFKSGHSIESISQQRNVKPDTIYNHLSQAIEEGMLSSVEVVDLNEKEIQIIEEATLNLPEDQKNALKPLFELFDETYSYGVLRCVRAGCLRKIEDA